MIANDLSPGAVEAIKRNVELNSLQEAVAPPTEKSENIEVKEKIAGAKVRINEGDAWYDAL